MKNKIFVSILLLLFGNLCYGQATKADPIDKQGWFSAGVDFNLPKKWKAEIEYQARVFSDLQKFNGSYYSIGVEKGFSPWFALQTEYRLSKVLRGTYNRFTFGFVLDKKIDDLKLDFRVLYQNQVQDFDDPIKESDKNNFIRMRMRGRKELTNKVDLMIAFEPIYQVQSGLQIDNYRIQGGLRYHFTKRSSIDVFYLNRPDYAKSYKRQYHVFGIAFKQEVKIK